MVMQFPISVHSVNLRLNLTKNDSNISSECMLDYKYMYIDRLYIYIYLRNLLTHTLLFWHFLKN